MRTVHVVVPRSVDDPARPSGGNTYDRRVCAGLEALGWSVLVHPLPGGWPHPEAHDLSALSGELEALPQDSIVLLDGLVASSSPDAVVPATRRLRVAVLVHLPLGHPLASDAVGVRSGEELGGELGGVPARGLRTPAEGERMVLGSAAAVLTTSEWTRGWLVDSYDLGPHHVRVATPGADPAPPATGTPMGAALLTVAAVVPAKGHAVLVEALASVRDLPWRLACAGTLDRDPDHVARLRRRCLETGIADRVTFAGPLTGDDLEREYAAADLLVVASRIETYGLVITEALAHALPVVATSVGGVPEAIGTTSSGDTPGRLVPPDAPDELGRALRSWLTDARLRERWKAAAGQRRDTLTPWSVTAQQVSDVLTELVP